MDHKIKAVKVTSELLTVEMFDGRRVSLTISLFPTLAEAAPSIRSKLLDEKSKQAIAAHLVVIKSALDWKTTTENLTFAYQRNET